MHCLLQRVQIFFIFWKTNFLLFPTVLWFTACYSNCGLSPSSITIPRDLVRNADFQSSLHISWIRSCILTGHPHPHFRTLICLYNEVESERESRSVVSDSLQPYGIVHGILQTRILEWVAITFSRGSSQPRDRIQVSHIAGGFFTNWTTREAHNMVRGEEVWRITNPWFPGRWFKTVMRSRDSVLFESESCHSPVTWLWEI